MLIILHLSFYPLSVSYFPPFIILWHFKLLSYFHILHYHILSDFIFAFTFAIIHFLISVHNNFTALCFTHVTSFHISPVLWVSMLPVLWVSTCCPCYEFPHVARVMSFHMSPVLWVSTYCPCYEFPHVARVMSFHMLPVLWVSTCCPCYEFPHVARVMSFHMLPVLWVSTCCPCYEFLLLSVLAMNCTDQPDGDYEISCKAYTSCTNGQSTLINCQKNLVFNNVTGKCDL